MKVTISEVVSATVLFILGGLTYQVIWHILGWRAYPIKELFPLAYGFMWGCFAIRSRVNKASATFNRTPR